MIFKKSFTRFALQSECCNFNLIKGHVIYNLAYTYKFQLKTTIDLYIGEHKKANEEQNDKSSFFGEMGSANFLLTMYDLFLAGSETTSTTLTW